MRQSISPALGLALSLLLSAGTFSLAQEGDILPSLPPLGVEANIGTNAIVYGKVARVSATNGVTYIEVDYRSRLALTALIEPGQSNAFQNLGRIVGKTIQVQGTIRKEPRGPQIVVTNQAQLQVIEGDVLAEEAAIRATALHYAFEHNPDMVLPQIVVAVLESDIGIQEVIGALSKWNYQIAPHPFDPTRLKEVSSIDTRDKKSGRSVLFWSVKVVARSATQVEIQVGCQYGMLKGIGHLITVTRADGAWKVTSAIANWIS